jgi:hypothetical protein
MHRRLAQQHQQIAALPHSPGVQALQISFQIITLPPALHHRLLRPGVFVASTVVVVRYWYGGLLLLLRLALATSARLHSHFVAEAVNFIEDHLLHIRNFLDDFELEVERCGA